MADLLEFQQVPADPKQAARLAVDALRLARDCLKVSGSPRALERTCAALSSARGAVRAVEYRTSRAELEAIANG